jgi:NDP-sugar pyrophosphorylase family protein
MAGGLGKRLRPLTDDRPKPMLSVGEKPLLEHIIGQLKHVGIRKIGISLHYMPDKITTYFGDGSAFGVEIEYFLEEQPLGTGGVLGLMPVPECSLLIINGDILTQVNFRSMYAAHCDSKAMLTLTVRPYSFQVPYGVIISEGEVIRGVSEKPKYDFLINAGIYLVDPAVYKYIPRGKKFNMTDLIQWLLASKEKVISFPIIEYWLDIGMHADYARAQIDYEEGTFGDELER